MGRLARLTSKQDVTGGRAEAVGTALGGGMGMLVRVAPTMQLDLGLTYSGVRFADAKVGGQTLSGTKSDGTNLSFRAGLTFGFGGWGVK